MKNDLLEFRADFIIAGTMYVQNKTEISYKQTQEFIKQLRNEVEENNRRCLILFSNEYLQEFQFQHKNDFYIGENFIALNKAFNLDYLKKRILSYQTADKINCLFNIKEKFNKIKNEI